MGRELNTNSEITTIKQAKEPTEEKPKNRFIYIIYPPDFHIESLNVLSNKD